MQELVQHKRVQQSLLRCWIAQVTLIVDQMGAHVIGPIAIRVRRALNQFLWRRALSDSQCTPIKHAHSSQCRLYVVIEGREGQLPAQSGHPPDVHHWCSPSVQPVQRADCLTDRLLHMGIDHLGLEVAVAQEQLDRSDVGACRQQVGSKGVSEGVN